ncbi:MAG: type II toxin-antitoxin system VapC family toxin [Acidobacteriota bacterium]
MIGIDTNVLVRYLTLDDAAQVERVDRRIRVASEAGDFLRIDSFVLCETVWVLDSVYEYSRQEIAAALEQVIDARQFEVDDRDSVRAALGHFRSGGGDFADYLIGERNRRAGCDTTLSFDMDLRKSPLFEAP